MFLLGPACGAWILAGYCTIAAAVVSLGKSKSGRAFTIFTVSMLTVIT
jgi:hypothetical protein